MTDAATLARLDEKIAVVRENLRDLTEQATVRSGASDENRTDDLIARYQDELDKLLRERETLAG